MKKLTFTIEIDDTAINSSFIDKLKDEVKDEERQLILTHKINKKTTQLHREILIDIVNTLNSELIKVDLKFNEYRLEGNTNQYKRSMVKCSFKNTCIVLVIGARMSDRNFKDSKYSTYTGDYKFYIGSNSSKYYTANQIDKTTTKVENVNDVLEYMRNHIKEHITTM